MNSDKSDTMSGPNELVGQLLNGRNSGRQGSPESYGNISDDGVRFVVTLAYYASQCAEEGDYPRFRIFIATSAELAQTPDPWQLGRFAEAIPLNDVDDLRRLAPCAASHDYALEVEEQENKIVCTGIRLAHSGEGAISVLSTSLWARHLRPGLMIRVDAPGLLRVSEAQRAWDLRAGGLSDLGSLPVQPTPLWLNPLAERLASKDRLKSHIRKMVLFAWNELLHSSSECGRGGCFVILPKSLLDADAVKNQYEISLKYPIVSMGLGKAISDFVDICKGTPPPSNAESLKEAVNEWLKARYSLLSHVESLAHLSGVDGCTVFDSNLNLVGFGGKILVSSTDHKKQLRDAIANRYLSADIMKKTGTRHLSAFHLCNAHEGVSCYVVSQDGQVTAFWSQGELVEQWKPYPAWVKRSDQY
ncbi:putative sensor domain DACNV-containing protein [Gimesia maris]|uniref:putative sensor domain DACNV-containing protein n=1 Tax=Gimesia maris TaxID=122 RepID=UPI003A95985F